jgi:hypothetical protein
LELVSEFLHETRLGRSNAADHAARPGGLAMLNFQRKNEDRAHGGYIREHPDATDELIDLALEFIEEEFGVRAFRLGADLVPDVEVRDIR